MRVLLVHNYYQEPGGEDTVFAEEKRLLRDNENEVLGCTLSNDSIKTMSSAQVAYRTMWNPQGYQLIKENIHKFHPEIIHFHNTFPLISPSGYEAAYEANIPVVQTLHNYRLLCLNSTLLRNNDLCEKCLNKTPPYPGVYYRCYRDNLGASMTIAAMLTLHRLRKTWSSRVNAFIALSEFARNKFIQGGLPAHKLFIKPNFISAQPESSERTHNEDIKNYFVFVGRLSPEKGIETLLQAAQVSKFPIKIIGRGPLEEKVKATIATHQLGHCEFLGHLPREKVLELIGNSIALLFPSIWYEGMPMTILEAYSQSTPVIASALGVMQEMVIEEKTGLLFEPKNVEQLVKKLIFAWENQKKMVKMGHEAKLYYSKHYSPGTNYKILMGIYQHVLASPNPAREVS